eukprot:756153-Hanusia_phi.AAC.2
MKKNKEQDVQVSSRTPAEVRGSLSLKAYQELLLPVLTMDSDQTIYAAETRRAREICQETQRVGSSQTRESGA